MDTHLVQITDLVKDYAKIIDELREENRFLSEDINSLKNKNEKLDETVRINVRLLGEKESQIAELKKNNLIRSESINNYREEILELRKKNSEFIKRLNDKSATIKDSSFWKQREELKEENKVLRQALSDIASNLGNGSTVSVEASLPFIKELPHEVKLVCDSLRKELAREKKTCNNLREEFKNPPPDVQEKVLDMLGLNKRMVDLIERYNELRREVEYYLKEFPHYNGTKAFEKILKKHDEQTASN